MEMKAAKLNLKKHVEELKEEKKKAKLVNLYKVSNFKIV